MRTNNNLSFRKKQLLFKKKRTRSDRSLVRSATQQIQSLSVNHNALLALGQYGIAILNLIQQTTQHLGICFYKQLTMAGMIGCSRDTVAVKLKALKELGLVQEEVLKRIGYKKVIHRIVTNKQHLKSLLMLFVMSISSIITRFSGFPTRLSIEVIEKEKTVGTGLRSGTFGGGVPPDIVSEPPSPDQVVDFARIVDQLWSTKQPETDKSTNLPHGNGHPLNYDAVPATEDPEWSLAKQWADDFRLSMMEFSDGQ